MGKSQNPRGSPEVSRRGAETTSSVSWSLPGLTTASKGSSEKSNRRRPRRMSARLRFLPAERKSPAPLLLNSEFVSVGSNSKSVLSLLGVNEIEPAMTLLICEPMSKKQSTTNRPTHRVEMDFMVVPFISNKLRISRCFRVPFLSSRSCSNH